MHRRANTAALQPRAAGRHAAAPKVASRDAMCRMRAPTGGPDAGDAARTAGAGTRKPNLRVRMCGKLLHGREAQEGPGRLPHSDRRWLNGDRSHHFLPEPGWSSIQRATQSRRGGSPIRQDEPPDQLRARRRRDEPQPRHRAVSDRCVAPRLSHTARGPVKRAILPEAGVNCNRFRLQRLRNS